MSDDPTATSAAADQPPVPDNNASSSANAAEAGDDNVQPTPLRMRLYVQAKKKSELLQEIMVNLDILIYAELCIVYYMDCSFFRLLIRGLAQVTFLTPKPASLPPMPERRPYVAVILTPNIVCILLHIITARSQAGETARGYLHGGIIMDFIGQKGPTSKTHLIILDLFIMALQCFMLAVHLESERMKKGLLPVLEAGLAATGAAANNSQDHDTEERGVLRAAVTDSAVTDLGDIEMQALGGSPNASAPGITEPQVERMDEEYQALLAEPSDTLQAEEDDHPLDMFYSGTAIVGEFHVLHNLRTQWNEYDGRTGDDAANTLGTSTAWALLNARAQMNGRRIAAVRR